MAGHPSLITCPSHAQSHYHGDSLSLHSSCLDLSSSAAPLGVTSGACLPLDLVSDGKTCYGTVDITEFAVNDSASHSLSNWTEASSNMSVDSRPSVSSRKAPKSSDILPTHKRTQTVPSAAPIPVSSVNRRSTSRSTARSDKDSRNDSIHSYRPAATNTSLTQSATSRRAPAEKREDLIALHREACRIFQSGDSIRRIQPGSHGPHSPTSTISSNYFSPHGGNSPADVGSPAASPVIRPQLSDRNLVRGSLDVDANHSQLPSHISANGSDAGTRSRQPSATVIDWTSPSTRRREYEKIDRASRGFRGLWRRVAPKWCQLPDRRTPFFEEGKDGKTNYEGSVRRFRMDIPEEPEPESDVDTSHIHFKILRRKRQRMKAEDGQSGKRSRRWPCILSK